MFKVLFDSCHVDFYNCTPKNHMALKLSIRVQINTVSCINYFQVYTNLHVIWNKTMYYINVCRGGGLHSLENPRMELTVKASVTG
jgi:hypothetical protein